MMMPPVAHAAGLLALTTLVRDCSVSGVSRRVLLLRTDLLPPRLARPHHLRLASEAIEPLTSADRARRYELAHGRIAISWRGDSPDLLRQALESLEHLLLDAPARRPGDAGVGAFVRTSPGWRGLACPRRKPVPP